MFRPLSTFLVGARHPGRGGHRDRRAGLTLGHDVALVITSGLCTSGGQTSHSPSPPQSSWTRMWHRILHEHVAERLQLFLQSLPRVVVISVPFHLAD